MDEGDRSDESEGSDRETESADIDTGTGGPEETDFERTDRDGDDAADDDRSDEGLAADVDDGDDQTDGDSQLAGGRSGTGRNGVEAARREPEASRDASRDANRNASPSDEGLLYRFRHDREGVLMWIREMLSSVAIVLLIGLILFGVSGVWPPMVAVESGSMEPNMEVGDLVFVTEPGRLAPDTADNDVGVVTHEVGEAVDYRTFGSSGSVVIYRPPERTASPIIHRAMFHVEEGENWYDRADDRYHSAADCGDLPHCPAPHDGFITLGDNNGNYDQTSGLAPPVKADWVTGVARVRVPYLGYVRLIATGQAEPSDLLSTTVAIQTGGFGVGSVSGGSVLDEQIIAADGNPPVSGGDATAGAVG